MKPDLRHLYQLMLKSRLFEEAVMALWHEGKIFGEMHLGIGEEGISAGIVSHCVEGDALALDHRGTPQFIMRGIDPKSLLLEFLGHQDGLCSGRGGHMHLYSKEHLVASSGIVGASCPAAVGFGLSAKQLRSGKIAVAFFGEGAMNQGMVMESFNLAAVWQLPVVFVCKDNGWAITTQSGAVTAGRVTDRASSFGLHLDEADGIDVEDVWYTAKKAIDHTRNGNGPSFLHITCVRPEGHFLGDPLIKISRQPVKEMVKIAGPLIQSMTKIKGSTIQGRSGSLGQVLKTLGKTFKEQSSSDKDPIQRLRKQLEKEPDRLNSIEEKVQQKIQSMVQNVLEIIENPDGSSVL